MGHISLSVKDFRKIVVDLYFGADVQKTRLCIEVAEGDIIFRLIYEDTTLTTYTLNEVITVDASDLLIMFDYKYIQSIIDKTDYGSIKFSLEKNLITVKIVNKLDITIEFMNHVDEHVIGKIVPEENSLLLDSQPISQVISYFIRDTKHLSNHFLLIYLYVTVKDSCVTFEKDSLTIKLKTSSKITIEKFKLHIDYLYAFLINKKHLVNIYICQDFPILYKLDTDFGHLEFYSSPIN